VILMRAGQRSAVDVLATRQERLQQTSAGVRQVTIFLCSTSVQSELLLPGGHGDVAKYIA